MEKERQMQEMTRVIADFVSYIARKLPDDVEAKLAELAADEKTRSLKLSTTR